MYLIFRDRSIKEKTQEFRQANEYNPFTPEQIQKLLNLLQDSNRSINQLQRHQVDTSAGYLTWELLTKSHVIKFNLLFCTR